MRFLRRGSHCLSDWIPLGLTAFLCLIGTIAEAADWEELFEDRGDFCSLLDGCPNLAERPTLFGDMGGSRTALGESGIKIDLSNTLTYQGVTEGGNGDTSFQFGGRNDYYVMMDGHKLGLQQGLFINLHGETRYGEGLLRKTGALSPSNTALLFPQSQDTFTALTEVKLTQFLSEHLAVFGGQINFVDGYSHPFAAGKGQTQFMNTALVIPPILGGTLPVYSTLGAGFAVMHNMDPVFSLVLLDPVNHAGRSGFDDAFSNGIGLFGNIHIPVTIAERPGHQDVFFAWSNRTATALDDVVYIEPPVGPLVLFSQISRGWTLMYGFDQYLVVDPHDPKRGWGVFGQAAISDGNPNPIRGSLTAGIGGNSPLRSRPLDTFGMGYYYFQLSTSLKSTLAPLAPLGNEHGVELYYNIAATKWFHITPDIQWIEPARGTSSSATVVGIRTKVDF